MPAGAPASVKITLRVGIEQMDSVIIVGSATVDEQVVRGATRAQLGGVVTYAGAAFVSGGVPAIAVCNLGGPWATSVRRIFDALGIRLIAGPSAGMTTFRNEISADGERQQHILNATPSIDGALVRRALRDAPAPYVHLGPLHGNDLAQSALQAITTSASLVTLDVQGLLRSTAPGPVRVEVSPSLATCLSAAKVVKADYVELGFMLDALGQSVEGLLEAFEIDELVVTMGSRGGYVATRSGRIVQYAAEPASRLHDTTGAGDVFFAVYLLERVHREATIPEACARAAAVASQHVAGLFIATSQLAL
jgi:sugar/nucleoside kinase (ribokinase family)